MSHKFVIIDEIMAQLESAKSGLIPSSVKQSIVSGIQNVPTAIKQPTVNGASGAAYTTFPLSPIIDNCCIDKTYLNLEFDVSFHVNVDIDNGANGYELPFFIGFRDTASIFNQIQFLIEGSVLWQTVYQREESVLAYNSLPETEIRGNNQYASIDKLRNNIYCPMKRIILKCGNGGKYDNNVTIHFKVTVDINRLSPIFSNLHFTTPHMGNLRLKVYLQEFAKCLFFCPDYGYSVSGKAKDDVVVLNPDMVQYWQFYSFNEWFGKDIGSASIPFFEFNNKTTGQEAAAKGEGVKIVKTVKFNNPTGGLDFMTFANGIAEIVQTNFAIKEEEYKRLNDYFAGLGSVIIPTNVWSTNVFNNSIITGGDAGASIPTSMIGNVSGYNIDSIAVWFHPTQSPCSFSKEFLTNTQLLLEGRPVNPIPYHNYGDKFVTDMTQALIDTDCEEINKDYMSSLTLFNFDGQRFYDEADYVKPGVRYGNGAKSINCSYLANPNTFCFNFSTNLPDAFHSGACVLENTNKQSVIRFISADVGDKVIDAQNRTNFPYVSNSKTPNCNIVAGFSCLCDACIVLSYDAARGTCFGGQLSWAAPYA